MEKKWTFGGHYRNLKAALMLLYISGFGYGASYALLHGWMKLPLLISNVLAIAFVLLALCFWWSSLCDMQPFWELDEKQLTYYHCRKFSDQMRMWFHKSAYSFQLEVSQIASIVIYEKQNHLFVYGNKMHNIWFRITMKNGSVFQMAALVDYQTQKFSEAIAYFRERGICVIDPLEVERISADRSLYLWSELEKNKDRKEKGHGNDDDPKCTG